MSNCNHTKSELTGHQVCIYNSAVEVGKEMENERIIKLLEDAIEHDWKGSEPCEACDQTDYLIALIKGEK